MPLRASPMRKRVWILKLIARCYYYDGSFIIYEASVFYKLDLNEKIVKAIYIPEML
jgi:hypothetical protein